jgi:hypothetical protein
VIDITYDFIIDKMEWSHSRMTSYVDCKYGWLLKYIMECEKGSGFFAEYGKFMHKIMQLYLDGKLKKADLVDYYLTHFMQNVTSKPPNFKIYENYFNQGITYLQSVNFPHKNIIGVEKEIHYAIGDKSFIGFIDVVSYEDGIIITDHKSKDLKPRSTRKTPLKSDLELDTYLRQLYLYSIHVREEYGIYPKWLEFNAFRTGVYIKELFDIQKYEETKIWAINLIKTITNNEDWKPNIDEWYCKYLCDVNSSCEYFELMTRK